MSGEQSLAQHFISSINSLKDLIRMNKDELEANINTTQTIFTENLKSLSTTFDLNRNGTILRMNEF